MIVPEPRYYLKNTKATEPTLICFQAKYECNRVFISTGNKIHPNEWDFILQRAKVNKKNVANGDINQWLDKMATEFKSIFRTSMIDGNFPDGNFITQKLQENLNLIVKPIIEPIKSIDLFTFIERYIKECEMVKSVATTKSYWATFRHLRNFAILTNKEFDFVDITIEWRSAFIKYLQGCGVSRSTEGKHIKIVKVFMGEGTERRLNTNYDFRSKSFSKPTEDVIKIFLTREEIDKLYNLDLTNDKSKEIVRDYFVISCMTSLRYSDVVDIKEENIKGDTIQLVTKKTGQEVIIPIAPIIKKILLRYDFNLPKAPCNQLFNRILKDVGKLAEIDEPIKVTKTIGGIKKTETFKKYELLTTHSGRRSMISNSILAGISTSAIMLISAHKSLKAFQGYVRIDQQQNASVLGKHAFFN